ncbi:NADPH:quinone oxidoreductase family protein [Verticiella sediminum]|uniref:NADPH:quinone oxidoreductase family protein n=1 Tax=Verticiella sediminum TaxID=1247510 RepID=A0A556AVG7_9BURK|nr:NADPH:quinone oxidoreductase family protein [Verticiella sediminum]TSH96900.1 NADPH:quinone oxidoreductase family protein [Verticiella sediminum]
MSRLAIPGDDFQALCCEAYGDWRELRVRGVRRAPLGPGEVRLAVRHVGVGFALSLFVAGKYQRKPPLPFSPGTEVAGEVLEVASDVRRLSPGQRVFAALDWGGFAEEAVVREETVYPLPDALPLAEAAGMAISYPTAWAALAWRAAPQPGETLLVHGASGALGMAAVHCGRAMGLRVLAVASTAAKREAALAHGAEVALDADAAALPAAVKAATGGRGADIVFDPVGGDVFDASLRCVASHARVLVIGFASGRIPQAPANLLLVKNVAVIGFNYGYYIGWGLTDERARYAAQVQGMVADMLQAWRDGRLALPTVQRYAFDAWPQAIGAVMGRASIGKVVVDLPA